jgi:hypothetical protein
MAPSIPTCSPDHRLLVLGLSLEVLLDQIEPSVALAALDERIRLLGEGA